MNAIRLSVTALLATASLFAQAKPRPEFEVASIKPSPPQQVNQGTVGVHIDGAQVRITWFSLKDYLSIAYRLKGNQILGPDWIGSEKFDIAAKIPEGVSREQIPEMVQVLLEDRFHLKTHRDQKEFAVYGLSVAKSGLKAQPLKLDPDDVPLRRSSFDLTASGGIGGVNLNYGHGSSFALLPEKLEVKKLSFPMIADILTRFTDRPVLDMTQAEGFYDFSAPITPEDYRALLIRSAVNAGVSLPPEAVRLLDGVTGDSVFTCLQQVGLKLDTRKAPLEVLVVDSALKAPTAN